MKPRVIDVEQAIGIVEGAMRTRAVTDEAREAWRVLRAELRRRMTPAEVLHRRVVTDESAARASDPRAVDESDDDEPTRRERRPL